MSLGSKYAKNRAASSSDPRGSFPLPLSKALVRTAVLSSNSMPMTTSLGSSATKSASFGMVVFVSTTPLRMVSPML